jgi:CRP-like cAMP-binding protein
MSEAPVDEKLAHIARRLRRIALCAELDDAALADVAGLAWPLVYARGAQLHEPARAAGSIYLIAEGRLRLYREALTGRPVTLDLVGEGEVFRFLAREPDGTPTSVAEVVSQRAVLYRFPGPALLEVLAAQPPALLRLVAELARALTRVYDDKAEVGLYDVETRLARALVRLAAGGVDTGGDAGYVGATHEELGWHINAAREDVTRYMRRFARLGLIATEPHRHGIVVRDDLHRYAAQRASRQRMPGGS